MEFTHRLVSTRAGTATLALLAALAAGVAVLVYVNHYRASVGDSGTAASVLVAKQPIPKGMSVATAVEGGYFEVQTLRKDQLTSGAVVDTAAIRNQVATRDVLPGEQITASAFGASAGGLAARLTGSERAVAVTLDAPHGLAGQVQQGDHVDVLVGFSVQSLTAGTSQPVVKTLLQDVPVLTITHPGSSVGSQTSSNVVLQVTPVEAAKVAYAAENGKVWLVLRPRVDAPTVAPSLVTLQSLLLGTKPVVAGSK
ncbi:MAG TPA: Flp pilus assembly protein CpaB [Gaiellaceae bacterium]|nr:Flp pilus assembly protein CpaB [Gaiellaceae bacterium]